MNKTELIAAMAENSGPRRLYRRSRVRYEKR